MHVLLQYQSKSYYIIGQEFITVSGVLLHYRAVITLSGVFYYIIGQLLQYRAFITLSVGTGSNHSVDIYGKIVSLFVLNHLKKILKQRHDRITMILLTYGCLVVVIGCWSFTREISDNRKIKCLQIPDYYRKFSYDTHTTIVCIIYNVRVTESAFTRNLPIYEKTCDVVTYDNY